MTVFLIGAECPFTCVFCDLWRSTLDSATPRGSLPRQLRAARRRLGGWPSGAVVKLYNASNFFDPRAVPPGDRPALARETAGTDRVVVECHPRFLADAEALGGFAADVAPARLEIALGVEVADPALHRRLGKGTELGDFERSAKRLRSLGIDWRAFVLVGPPFVDAATRVRGAVETVAWAADRGARHVSLIPTRAGNGTLERLEREGMWSPPTLQLLEETLERALGIVDPRQTVVSADLWDLERLATCPACRTERGERLERANFDGAMPPPVECGRCG